MTNSPTTLRSLAMPTALDARVVGLAFIPVRAGLWRVTGPTGAVLGHIEHAESARADAGAQPGAFVARQSLGGARSRSLGEFWSAQAAAECFG